MVLKTNYKRWVGYNLYLVGIVSGVLAILGETPEKILTGMIASVICGNIGGYILAGKIEVEEE